MPAITIYHNPNCGTSRNVLALIRNSGVEPEVIEYLKTPPTRQKLQELAAQMAVPVREVLRQKGAPYDELGLGDPALTDNALIDAMLPPPHPHQPAHCGHAAGHMPVPAVGVGAGHSAAGAAGRFCQGRRRAAHQRAGRAHF